MLSAAIFFWNIQRSMKDNCLLSRLWAVCNATLHRLATDRKLQNYIRDAPFDPLRWLAPGQCTLHLVPCKCGVDIREVPLMHPTDIENNAIKFGAICDRVHRWLCYKTIADGLEALTWVGIDLEHEQALVTEATRNTSRLNYAIQDKDIESLESKLRYKFLNTGLLLEAIIHTSKQGASLGCCYQRPEFLGDSVLDPLITWHLFWEP